MGLKSTVVNLKQVNEAKVKTTKSGQEFIKFKCPGHKGDDEKFTKSVLRTVDRNSIAFTGVPISDVFLRPNGDFRLNGTWYFRGSDGDKYAWTGADTENWKGFSIIIFKPTPSQQGKIPEKLVLK